MTKAMAKASWSLRCHFNRRRDSTARHCLPASSTRSASSIRTKNALPHDTSPRAGSFRERASSLSTTYTIETGRQAGGASVSPPGVPPRPNTLWDFRCGGPMDKAPGRAVTVPGRFQVDSSRGRPTTLAWTLFSHWALPGPRADVIEVLRLRYFFVPARGEQHCG